MFFYAAIALKLYFKNTLFFIKFIKIFNDTNLIFIVFIVVL